MALKQFKTKMMLDEKINHYENLSLTIAKSLKEKGYEISDALGGKLNTPEPDIIGILEPQWKNFLGFNLKIGVFHLGNLWFDNEARSASYNKKWVMEVYGKENEHKLVEIVKEFSEPSNVELQTKLKTENNSSMTLTYFLYSFFAKM